MSHELDSQAVADSARDQCGQCFEIAVVVCQQFAHEHPRTRSSKGLAGRLWIKVIQVLFGKAHVTNNLWMHLVHSGPVLPVFEVHFHLQVNEAVSQGSWHAVSNTAIAFTVTSGNHVHTLGQFVSADTAVQDQLIGCGLHSWRSRVKFVQEDHSSAVSIGWQLAWRSPNHLALVAVVIWDTFDVCRFPQGQTHVDDLTTQIVANLLDEIAFANARRTPQEHWTTSLDRLADCLLGRLGTYLADGNITHLSLLLKTVCYALLHVFYYMAFRPCCQALLT